MVPLCVYTYIPGSAQVRKMSTLLLLFTPNWVDSLTSRFLGTSPFSEAVTAADPSDILSPLIVTGGGGETEMILCIKGGRKSRNDTVHVRWYIYNTVVGGMFFNRKTQYIRITFQVTSKTCVRVHPST